MFEIRQRRDADGALRLTLIGELDIAVADGLRDELDRLRRSHRRVRLDLSELAFIDCYGVGGIVRALREARRDDWDLEVDAKVSPSVGRVAAHDEIASALWPGVGGHPPHDEAPRGFVVSAV
ncbi:MAG TPA: STAS domain-containing protein [Solirubrobacteraceae bacterium]|nr:STAS domain-containing protein [Solirubrobacteraceae bacterium]